MNRAALLTSLALVSALAGCNPPPSDAAAAQVSLLTPSAGPSAPLPSPDTAEAIWAQSAGASARADRLVYGVPGQPVLVSLECLGAGTPGAQMRIIRQAPADRGAGALLALIGNRIIARIAVDATPQGGKVVWQGEAAATLPGWDALAGTREATITVPGAGLVRLNPSPLPVELVKACREIAQPSPPTDQA